MNYSHYVVTMESQGRTDVWVQGKIQIKELTFILLYANLNNNQI